LSVRSQAAPASLSGWRYLPVPNVPGLLRGFQPGYRPEPRAGPRHGLQQLLRDGHTRRRLP